MIFHGLSELVAHLVDELQAAWAEELPELDAEALSVVVRIQLLGRLLSRHAEQALEPLGLKLWEYDVLSALRRQGRPYRLTASELGDAGRLTSGAMTNRIDRLEEEGLVRRLKDDADRRKVLVQLTDKGLKLIESATEARFETAMDALESLSARQRNALSDLLRMVLMSQED